MSATELLKGAVETRTVVNASKIHAAFKEQGWEIGSAASMTGTRFTRGNEAVYLFTVGDVTTVAREVGGSTAKLARLIGPRKPREKKASSKKK